MHAPSPIAVTLVSVSLLVALAGPSQQALASDRVAVAWDDTTNGEGRVAAISVDQPEALRTPALAVGPDGRVRAAFGRVFHLSRADGLLRVIDDKTWQVLETISLGADAEVRDIAVVDPTTAYISRRSAASLLRVDLETGVSTESVDLSGLGAGALRMQETLLADEGKLWVQLPADFADPQPPHLLALVDLSTETLVDADPTQAGTQGVSLQGTGPRFKMQRIPETRELLLSATGSFHDFGGLEVVDVDALVSSGVAVEEWFDVAGNDIGAFAMIDAERGWLAFSTDIVLSSHLNEFTLSGGGMGPEADNSLFYFAPHLVHHPRTDLLFWPKPGGVRAFDGTSGTARAALAPLSGNPTDLALIAAACHNGIDDDGDGRVDFDGGVSVLGSGHPGVSEPDLQCTHPERRKENAKRRCGLGGAGALGLALALALRGGRSRH